MSTLVPQNKTWELNSVLTVAVLPHVKLLPPVSFVRWLWNRKYCLKMVHQSEKFLSLEYLLLQTDSIKKKQQQQHIARKR